MSELPCNDTIHIKMLCSRTDRTASGLTFSSDLRMQTLLEVLPAFNITFRHKIDI